MNVSYNNPEGDASYYGNQFNPYYGYSNITEPKRRIFSSTFAFKNGMSLRKGNLYNSAHSGVPGAKSPMFSAKGLSPVVASANILRNKMIQIKDHQNGKRMAKNGRGASLMKKGSSHFQKNWSKSLVYSKNYPNYDSKAKHKSIYHYVDEDIGENKNRGYLKRNSDYKSLFDHDNDDEIIKAREEFRKERKNKIKTDYKNEFMGRKKFRR